MDGFKLEVAQMVNKHPILNEKDSYKRRYINVLEYFVRKYSPNSNWANESLKLYNQIKAEDNTLILSTCYGSAKSDRIVLERVYAIAIKQGT